MPSRAPSLKVAKIKASVVKPKRPSSTSRGYGSRWQKARSCYLQKHPICVICEAENIVTVATDLDHIIPHKNNKELFWDSTNWQSLCKSCHSKKTASEDGGFGNKVKTAKEG